jgi:DNA helicase-2/ATP-dependent DNA helicase PcrA
VLGGPLARRCLDGRGAREALLDEASPRGPDSASGSRVADLSGLNPSQLEAVKHEHGPLLVLAGAGSGKTRVVTTRIARLVERGIPPRALLAMTFTNKAAAEMLERVEKLVGHRAARDLTVGTFHSVGLSVLRAETRALGLRAGKFVIYDQADCTGVVREVLRSVKGDRAYDVGAILGRISVAKNAFIEPEDYERGLAREGVDPSEYDAITAAVYPRYVAMMRGLQAYDFDDLICEVVRLWRARGDVLAKYRERFRFVIVDEYQDTNHAQLEMLRLLCDEHRNVCVVGDDDQSIYAWRGADVRNILDFERHFPGAKVVKLQENYRSNANVLKVAANVLDKSSGRRHEKTIVATRAAAEPVEVVVCGDAEIEAKFVARTIERHVRDGRHRPRDFAVLYRSNLQGPDLEAAFKEESLPIRMIGGTQFFERKEVKDMLAYLRLAFVPDDEIAARRVINYPARGVGDVALEKLGSYATAYGLSLLEAAQKAHAIKGLGSAAVAGCRDFATAVESVKLAIERGDASAKVARDVCERVRLKDDLQVGSTSNAVAARRWGNVEGLIKVFERRDARGLGGKEHFEDFLRLLGLNRDDDDDAHGDAVTLTTMHGAKGLEFPIVFIVGLEEGLLPHARTQTERATDVPMGDHASSVEEERRLFYVSVTRAKDKLYLMRAHRRLLRGKLATRVPSRFLEEIPPDLYELREEKALPRATADELRAGAAAVLAALSKAGPPKF